MQTLKAYLYSVDLEVQIPDPTIFTVRKRTVYSHPIKVYQGIDNPIQITISNQDNKPLDLTGYSVRIFLQDPLNQATVTNYEVSFVDITQGRGTVIIDRETLDSLERRVYKLAIKRINLEDNSETPVYTDANYGVPVDLVVLPGYYS